MIQAMLWDIGGPINDETEQEARFDDVVLTAARARRDVSAEEYVDICARAVTSFAPRAYRFIMWELADHDRVHYEHIREQVSQSDFERFCLRPEIPPLLARLAETKRLGIAANSGARMLAHLERVGILKHFRSRKPGAVVGLDKPDVRYFQLILDELDASPEEAVMIGDRIDCDMVPSKTLGMKCILLRVGRHKNQQPRFPEEAPDAEIHNLSELDEVLNQW